MNVPKTHDLCAFDLLACRTWCASQRLKPFRGTQIFTGIHKHLAKVWAEVPGLSASEKAQLAHLGPLLPLLIDQEVASSDGTVKWRCLTWDKHAIECVSIPAWEGGQDDEDASGVSRHTVCISTQVGCPVGCPFCASGAMGFIRNLSASEIVAQVLIAARRQRVTNVVVMGMGEPLFNLDALLAALRILGDPAGLNLGRRRFTISTSGIPAGIEILASAEPQINLALSLHACDTQLRNRLVPINRKYPLSEVLNAIDAHRDTTHRRPTFEYTLLQGLNDSPADAQTLAALARKHHAFINLIAVNTGGPGAYQAPGRPQQEAFLAELIGRGANAVLRRSRGAEIAAACGQLAGKGN